MLFDSDRSDSIRAQFPALRELTFLNSSGMTPIPLACRDVMTRMIDANLEYAYLKGADWEKSVTQTRQDAARLVGCAVDELAFVKNTSVGVSLVASGLRLAPGDEVIINDLEFPSNVYPWLNLQRKGVVVRIAKSSSGRVTSDAIAAEVTAKTRVVAISSVQYATGHRTDLAALGQMAKDHGFLLFVDAIQSLGVLPMDVKKFGIHFLSAGGFKWLCGPVGSGVFFCDMAKLEDLDIVMAGWNTVRNPILYHEIDFTPKNNAQRFEEGSGGYVGICGLGESVKLLLDTGIDSIESHVVSLTDYLEQKLRSRGIEIHSPRDDGDKSGVLVFRPAAGESPEALFKRLEEKMILTAPRGGGLRVSPHFFNTTADLDRLLEAL